MKQSDIARRYVKALFELVTDNRQQESILNELRLIQKSFADKEIQDFITSPVIATDKKLQAVSATVEGKGLSEESQNFILLLAKKGRLGLFDAVVDSFQDELDRVHGIVRGTVKSAIALDENERKNIQEKVSQFLKRNAILNFQVDSKVVGGLVATVGSYTFDDSISSYLKRLKENLNRSAM